VSAKPRYPVYIPSKGRADNPLTAEMFDAGGVPFRLMVEPQERDAYAKRWGAKRVVVLPENNRGLVYSRNACRDHSVSEGHARHWQFDDDIKHLMRMMKSTRVNCDPGTALAVAEDFTDRYENVGLTSFNYWKLTPYSGPFGMAEYPPFYLNFRCYTCFLMLNEVPCRWRGRYNEDTDMTLQVLSEGLCTVLLNAFLIDTMATSSQGGGQSPIYVADGRLQMARELERRWPGVVQVKRRFNRPQHVVNWKIFTTQLKLKAGIDLSKLPDNDYGLTLKAVKEIESESLQRFYEQHKGESAHGNEGEGGGGVGLAAGAGRVHGGVESEHGAGVPPPAEGRRSRRVRSDKKPRRAGGGGKRR
jgi:hypothetical protein